MQRTSTQSVVSYAGLATCVAAAPCAESRNLCHSGPTQGMARSKGPHATYPKFSFSPVLASTTSRFGTGVRT